jgi:hypothetical protein
VVPAQDEGAVQVGDNVDDMAITAFPVLAPRLRSVAYPDNLSRTSRSMMVDLTPTFGCRPTTSPSRQLAATSITWRPTSRW